MRCINCGARTVLFLKAGFYCPKCKHSWGEEEEASMAHFIKTAQRREPVLSQGDDSEITDGEVVETPNADGETTSDPNVKPHTATVETQSSPPVGDVKGIGDARVKALATIGVFTIRELIAADPYVVAETCKVGYDQVVEWLKAAEEILNNA